MKHARQRKRKRGSNSPFSFYKVYLSKVDK
nr:MAG TPA: hypothetical protein [Caudoviricetes sp.]